MAFRKSSSEARARSSASGCDSWPNVFARTPRTEPLSSGAPAVPNRRPISETSSAPVAEAAE
eukprot:12461417-Alexandrium_andersonii.AAC.1